MGQIGLSLAATNVQAYRDLSKRLRTAGARGKGLRANLRKQIVEAGKPAVEEVKQAVLAIPITSHGGGGAQRRSYNVGRATTARAKKSASRRNTQLRSTIASATRMQITAKGIRIVVNSSKLPEDQRSLPRHLDSAKGWRHPTFAHSPWVRQKGKPYFGETIKKHAPDIRRAVVKAMDETIAQIEG